MHLQCSGQIYSDADVNNVKFMYSSTSGHIVDSSEFI